MNARNRIRSLLLVALLALLAWPGTASAQGRGNTNGLRLASGLYTHLLGEKAVVRIVATDPRGSAIPATVSFFDENDQLVGTANGMVGPGSSLSVEVPFVPSSPSQLAGQVRSVVSFRFPRLGDLAANGVVVTMEFNDVNSFTSRNGPTCAPFQAGFGPSLVKVEGRRGEDVDCPGWVSTFFKAGAP